jgi:hypothetical protein
VYSNTIVANAHITVSGTGLYKHGDRFLTVGFGGAFVTTGTLSAGTWTSGPPIVENWVLSGTGRTVLSITGLLAGWRIKTVLVKGSSANAGTLVITRQVYDTANAVAYTGTGNFDTAGEISAAVDTPFQLAVGEQVFVDITAGAGDVNLTHVTVTFDQP